jgi:RimJ/RimL family protein N-acetyltransferase
MTRAKTRRRLEGPLVRLTPLQSADSAALFRWINDRELVIFNAGFHPVHASQHAAWMKRIVDSPDVAIFAIRQKRSERLVGVCQLHSISSVHRSAELQIRIGEAGARGRGYGTEAVRLLVDFAFRDLNLHRVWLRVFRSNTRALKTYAAAGFVREGVMRDAAFVDGRFVDVVVMRKLQRA